MPKTVMIADDDYLVQASYKHILESHSHKVIVADNGFDAITKYIEFLPQIVLMEPNLPKMSGYKAVWQIKEFDEMANITIIGKQIAINEEYVKIQEKYDIPIYLKPIDYKSLLKIVEGTLVL